MFVECQPYISSQCKVSRRCLSYLKEGSITYLSSLGYWYIDEGMIYNAEMLHSFSSEWLICKKITRRVRVSSSSPANRLDIALLARPLLSPDFDPS